ncbi:hypothetical protein WG219_11910 [Ectopseudomonas mendocina]|uniref:N-acetyltransferase domain-containing protein n=1 Tax=Ectopseudomonas mendocina TaxID=300 RepID=A0ABZ2RAK7_ECTME
MTENTTPEAEASAEDQELEEAHPWAELPPEEFRLLRLAPLPVDKYTGPRPLRFIQLGYVERGDQYDSVLRLTLHLPDQRVHKEQNVLEVWANHTERTIHFGPPKGLSPVPENRGLGRFLMAQAAEWARKKYSHYQVKPMALPSKDAFSEESRSRRDHALQAQGFTIEYLDPLQMTAQCTAQRVSSLHTDWNKEKVQVLGLVDAASMLEQADHNLHEQENKIRKLEERITAYKRDDSGLRFTIACLVTFSVFQAALLIWIATH